jgi:predicted transcriptional regulator
VDIIDKPFIKDRVKGMFFITTKSVDKPRIYYYFTKNRLLSIYEKYGNLDVKTVRKVRRKYSLYRGWFRDYKGFLKEPYLAKKNPRMVDKVKEFVLKFGSRKTVNGEKLYDKKLVANLLNYSPTTISKYVNNGVLARDVDIITSNGNNATVITETGVLKLFKRKKENTRNLHLVMDREFFEWAEKRCMELGI